MKTIAYTDFLANFAPEVPTLPVFRIAVPHTIEGYFPDWAPVIKLDHRYQQLQGERRDPCIDVVFVLVTDVPQEQLFGDWAAQCPEEATPCPST